MTAQLTRSYTKERPTLTFMYKLIRLNSIMPMTVTTRRHSSSLLALASLCALGVAGCAAKYNNAAGITPQPVEILWNTTGPAQVGSIPVAPTPTDPNPPVPIPAAQTTLGVLYNTTPLGPNELNATANTLGTFVYTPAEGTFLSPGTQTLSVTFTPVDTTNYAVTTRTVQIVVSDISAVATAPIPEAVQIIGGGYVDGVFFHPLQQNLRYVRTDVGGAYRWDQQTFTKTAAQPTQPMGNDQELMQYGNWTPLLDFLGRANAGDMGVESLGLDPSDAKRLYLSTGLNYNNDATQQNHFYLSDDQGATFTMVNAPFPINGNAVGRDAGERFGVDPNLGTTIYYGTRTAGLWKSIDRGMTWNQVTTFPVTGPTNGAGVVFVSFAAASGTSGTATPVIYAGVSDYSYYTAGGANNGTPTYSPIYRSVDSGATWQAVPGQPTTIANPSTTAGPTNYNLTPIHGVIGADGVTNSTGSFYVTYFSDAGPMSALGLGAGAVYQYTPTPGTPAGPGTWTNITPTAVRNGTDTGGYGGLALDPAKAGTIMVGTMDDYGNGDDIYRSLDYGQNWVSLKRGGAAAINDVSNSPWLPFGGEGSTLSVPGSNVGTWPSTIAIDPFSSQHVEYGTGQTLWDTIDVENADLGQAQPVIFEPAAYGAALGGTKQVQGGASIEETVVNSLSSPPSGAFLLSAVDDLGTFTHLNLDVSPVIGADSALGTIFGNGTGVDFAQNAALTLVRVGTASTMTATTATYVPVAGAPAGTTCNATSNPMETNCAKVAIPQLLAISTEGGESADNNEWTGVSALYNNSTQISAGGGTVAISPDASSIVWAPSDFPPACTGNSGSTWTPIENGVTAAQVISDRVTPGVYYQYDPATGNVLMGTATISPGSAASPFQCSLTFNIQSTISANSAGQLAASYGAAGEIWLAINGSANSSSNGLYHSTDFGKTLTKISVFTSAYAVGLGASATGSSFAMYSTPAIYTAATGAAGYGVYRSIDDAATWVLVISQQHLEGAINVITGDARTFGRYYIGTSGRGIGYVDSQ